MLFHYFKTNRIDSSSASKKVTASEDEQRREHPILYTMKFDHFTISM